jgi:hypothetical protein
MLAAVVLPCIDFVGSAARRNGVAKGGDAGAKTRVIILDKAKKACIVDEIRQTCGVTAATLRFCISSRRRGACAHRARKLHGCFRASRPGPHRIQVWQRSHFERAIGVRLNCWPQSPARRYFPSHRRSASRRRHRRQDQPGGPALHHFGPGTRSRNLGPDHLACRL